MTVIKCSASILARGSARITSIHRKSIRKSITAKWKLLLLAAVTAVFLSPVTGLSGPASESKEPVSAPNHSLNQKEREKSTTAKDTWRLGPDAETLSYSKIDTSTTESYDFISKSVEIGSKANIDLKSVDNKDNNRQNAQVQRPKVYRDTFLDSIAGNSTNVNILKSNRKEHTFAIIADSDVKILQTDNGKAVLILTDDDEKFLESYMGEDGKRNESSSKAEEVEELEYQADMPFRRLPPLEINANEVMSELNVKQVLECNLPSNATYSHWSKDGEKMDMILDGPGVRSRLLLTKAGYAVISRVIKDDDGSWVCHGHDRAGAGYSSDVIKLIVLEVPYNSTLEIAGVKIIGDSERVVTVKEGTTLNATCNIRGGRPKPTYTWSFLKSASDEYLPIDDYKQISKTVTDKEIVSVIQFDTIKQYHNSTITCYTYHLSLAKPMRSTARLHVEYAPRFIISRYPSFGKPLFEGMYVALKCEVDSYPPASEPLWLKDDYEPDLPQFEDGFLNFTSLKKEHSGWYKCTTNHTTLGRFSSIGYFLNVRYDPIESTREPEDQDKPVSGKVEAALGGVVQLQCPEGSIGCWGKRSDDGEWTGAGSTAPHGALSISGLLYQEAGEYRCEGLSPQTHGQLKVLKETTIVVTGGPTVSPANKTILVSEGQSATFSAEYCANPAPTRVLWISSERLIKLGEQTGQILAHNATNASAPGCSIAQLTIESAGLQHNGEFSLLVRNALGSKEAVFQLAVTATRKVSKTESIFNDWLGINGATTPNLTNTHILCSIFFITVTKILFQPNEMR